MNHTTKTTITLVAALVCAALALAILTASAIGLHRLHHETTELLEGM